METRARYTLMGLFALAVIAAGLGFVYWLKAGGGFRTRVAYRIQYDGPVAGLMKGSVVLFNGVRVGEVSDLRLDPSAPERVVVDVAIDRAAPVRADTRVGIDFQGLAGAPAVSLVGGTASAALPVRAGGAPPLLVAEKNAGQSLTQAARDVLRQVSDVVATNADALKSAVANIDRFSGALARNSDKVDGIVAGIERLTGANKGATRVYDIAAAPPAAFATLGKRAGGLLHVADPTALGALDNDRIAVRGGERPGLEAAQWPDLVTKLVQARLVQSFENAGHANVMARVPDGARADYQLLVEVRRFELVAGAPPSTAVEIAARLVAGEGRIVDTRVFTAAGAAPIFDPAQATQALSETFQNVAAELVAWTLRAM